MRLTEIKIKRISKYNEFKAVTETAYLGSILQKLYVEDLRKYDTITPTDVKVFKFNADYVLSEGYYNHPDCKDEQGRFLFESNYIQGIDRYRYVINAVASNIEYNQVVLFNSQPLSIIPPNFVNLEIIETDPGLKGDTANKQK